MARFRIENDGQGRYPWYVARNEDGEPQALDRAADHAWLRPAADNPGLSCSWATREELVAVLTGAHFTVRGDDVE